MTGMGDGGAAVPSLGVDRPPQLAPMLAGTTRVGSGDWLAEPKWDGVRAIVTVDGPAGSVRLVSRNGNEVTGAYPELRRPPASLAGHVAVLDGEIVALGPDARADFGLLQRRMHVRNPPPQLVHDVPVTVFVFDVLWLDGEPLVDLRQRQRRQRLEALAIADGPWVTTPLFELPPGPELLDTCRQLGFEGYMAKRADAPYQPGRRTDAWCKVKCRRRREFVVGGWLEGKKSRAGALGSLALGVWDEGRLRFVGMVGSGLSAKDVDAFASTDLHRRTSPFAGPTPPGVRFLEPVLVAEVTFSEVTAAGTLRHPVLEGFRTDIPADEVVVDAELLP